MEGGDEEQKMEGRRKRKRKRVSKAERLAKKEPKAVDVAAVVALVAAKRSDEAEALARRSGHTVAFLDAVACPRLQSHYCRRLPQDFREPTAAVLVPALVAKDRIEEAAACSRALGGRPIDIVTAALDVVNPVLHTPFDVDVPDEESVASLPKKHGVVAQVCRAVTRDVDLAAEIVLLETRETRPWDVVQRTATSVLRRSVMATPHDLGPRLLALSGNDQRCDLTWSLKIATEVATAAFPGQKVVVRPFGSMVTGLSDETNDIDVTILIGGHRTRDRRRDALKALATAASKYTVTVVPSARVPYLRLQSEGQRIDVVLDNLEAIANTKALSILATRVPGLRPVVRVVRRFARAYNITGAKAHHLSNYAWSLLCVFALQRLGTIPSIDFTETRRLLTLPCDQVDQAVAELEATVITDLGNVTENTDDLLAQGFVEVLRIVAFGDDIIALRGSSDQPKLSRRRRDCLRIEDPIELDHDLGAPLTPQTATYLRHTCLAALVHLHQGTTVDRLFTVKNT